jgi:hypothetical protein
VPDNLVRNEPAWKKLLLKCKTPGSNKSLFQALEDTGAYQYLRRHKKLLHDSYRNFFNKPFTTNSRYVEVEITSFCNLTCMNCDRSCTQAPTGEHMSLEQIKKFVDESIELNWKWERIRVIGGEPTLHPKFHDILHILEKYKRLHPEERIDIVTNGSGERVHKILSEAPDWVQIESSEKTSEAIVLHSSYNLAPVDLPEYENEDFSTGCVTVENCGFGLTGYGFYPCGPGASLDRRFGFNIGIKSLSDVTTSNLRDQLRVLCKYCGHYKDKKAKFRKKMQDVVSPSWRKAYDQYKDKKPELTLF